jgi:CheY-like chemotaxis protein
MLQGLKGSFEPAQFLIIDDDEVSIMAIKRSMRSLKMENQITIAHDGAEAIEILQKAILPDGILPPIIVTLDLNMPKMGGLQFLEHIRADPTLKKLVVFVLTSSDAPGDIASAFDKNVAGYILKQSQLGSIKDTWQMLKAYADTTVLA